MDWKKILKYIYGAGDSSHGNIGVLPERGKGPAPAPKQHVDINEKEHDMDKYNRDWVIHTSMVIYELRKHVNEDRKLKQALENWIKESVRMNENIEDMFEELTKEQKQAKLAEWSCKMDMLTVMLNAIEDDLENRLSNQFRFREFDEFKDEFSNLVFEFNQLDLKLKLTQIH